MCVMGMVEGCGYDDQQMYTICDTCRQCHSILGILKKVFHQILCVLTTRSDVYKSLDLMIFVSTMIMTMTTTEPIALSLGHVCGVNNI